MQICGYSTPIHPRRHQFTRITGSKSGDYEEIREKQFTKLLSNGSLLLQNVKEDREGFYLCQAHNGIGSGISKVIQLKVNCKYILNGLLIFLVGFISTYTQTRITKYFSSAIVCIFFFAGAFALVLFIWLNVVPLCILVTHYSVSHVSLFILASSYIMCMYHTFFNSPFLYVRSFITIKYTRTTNLHSIAVFFCTIANCYR